MRGGSNAHDSSSSSIDASSSNLCRLPLPPPREDLVSSIDSSSAVVGAESMSDLNQQLRRACGRGGRAAVVESLLRRGADIEVRDDYERTPLHLSLIHI